MNDLKLAVVVLAAGKGTRMNSELPKVLHKVAGRELILRVMDSAKLLAPDEIVVVVGHGREQVRETLSGSGVRTVVQDPPMGTGHAVMQAEPEVSPNSEAVLILSGDVPLLRAATLRSLIQSHQAAEVSLTVLSTNAPDPTGYGRILRDETGKFLGIAEEKDASEDLRKISEINSGIYVVERNSLFAALHDVRPNNAKGEYYLTDIVRILVRKGEGVQAVLGGEFLELQGINTPEELRRAEAALRGRLEV